MSYLSGAIEGRRDVRLGGRARNGGADMICRPHPPTAPLAFACPRCGVCFRGGLLSFARAGVAA
jgi:hypothetical protein